MDSMEQDKYSSHSRAYPIPKNQQESSFEKQDSYSYKRTNFGEESTIDSNAPLASTNSKKEAKKKKKSIWDSDSESEEQPIKQPPSQPIKTPISTSPLIEEDPEQDPSTDIEEKQLISEPTNSDGCRNVNIFRKVKTLGEGTYGVVYKAVNMITNEVVALKKIKFTPNECNMTGFPVTALREVNILLSMHHPNIIPVREMVMENSMPLTSYMVMDYIPLDMATVVYKHQKTCFSQSQVKCLLYQLLQGCQYMHSKWIIHRDLKLSNLLYKNGNLYICDFGLARLYSEPLKYYTQEVVSLGYRAPELLLNTPQNNQQPNKILYDDKLDMWSVGCIFFEFLTGKPFVELKAGDHEFDALCKIFKRLGLPSEEYEAYKNSLYYPQIINKYQYHNTLREVISSSLLCNPYLTGVGYDLLLGLLEYDPKKRLSAEDALNHNFFKEKPLMCPLSEMPVYDYDQEPVSADTESILQQIKQFKNER